MRVDGNGVAEFDTADEMAISVAKCCGGAVSAVEMKPEILTSADFGESRNIVDGSGVCSASGSDYAERFVAGGTVVADGALQSVEVKLDAVGYVDSVQCFAAEAEQADGFVERVVRFGGGVNHRRRTDGSDAVFN